MRNIIKRDGTVRPYEPEKIITAMGKAFRETAAGTSREEMERLLRAVEKEMEHKDGGWAVEDIQDAVERVLMENGRYEEAKRYILYRHRRNEQRAARRAMAQAAGVPALDGVLAKIEKDFPGEAYALTVLNAKFQSFVKPGMGADAALEALVKAAVELTSQEAPRWEFIAARLLNARFGRSLEEQLRKRGIGGLYDKLRRLTDEGLYGEYILAHSAGKRSSRRRIFCGRSGMSCLHTPGWTCCSSDMSSTTGPTLRWRLRRRCFWASHCIWPCVKSGTAWPGYRNFTICSAGCM